MGILHTCIHTTHILNIIHKSPCVYTAPEIHGIWGNRNCRLHLHYNVKTNVNKKKTHFYRSSLSWIKEINCRKLKNTWLFFVLSKKSSKFNIKMLVLLKCLNACFCWTDYNPTSFNVIVRNFYNNKNLETFHFSHEKFNLDLGLIETCYKFSHSALILSSILSKRKTI